ncbi:MAG TPA: GAF domain-containing protein [Steroidobacteraceae bacterium]|jgi:GAF domain-containing protein|nr:GAF domain-containing protein [Steroidobacteraceae bacterium]
MHESDSIVDPDQPKPVLYAEIARQVQALTAGERDLIANLANTASLLYHSMPDLNWLGFYLLKEGELVVGPFQGKPACVRIAMGKGVCGVAAARRAPVIVANVHEFDGHIACDSASNSEIVLPILRGNELLGVLDVDSPKFSRFDAEDQAGLEQVVAALLQAI